MNCEFFIYGKFGVPGGVGHALIDLYTPLLLSEVLGIQFLYTPIGTVPIARHDVNIRGIAEHERQHHWDDVFGLKNHCPLVENSDGYYDEIVRLEGHG